MPESTAQETPSPISTLPKLPSSSSLLGCDQNDPLPCHHAVRPVCQGCGGNGIIGNVNEAAEHNGDDHDEGDFFEGEIKLLGSLGNGVKANVGPRCDGERRQDGGENAGGASVGGFGNPLPDLIRLDPGPAPYHSRSPRSA